MGQQVVGVHIPESEGIDHLNIYSDSRFLLGGWMSNWWHCQPPLLLPEGEFASVEAYWYFISRVCSGKDEAVLKPSYGFMAKAYGRALEKSKDLDEEEFQAKIKNSIVVKIGARQDVARAIRDSALPLGNLARYYMREGEVVEAE